MTRLKQAATVAGTFAVALGIGFVMQNGDALAARGADAPERVSFDPLMATTRMANTGPTISFRAGEPGSDTSARAGRMMIAPTFSHTINPEIENEFIRRATSSEGRAQNIILAAADSSDCVVTLAAEPADDAMVELTLMAPCHGGQVVSIYHQGLLFGDILNDEGQFSVTVPALKNDGLYIATFEDGEGAVARALAPEAEEYLRAVVQWSGAGGFELHARENNADYGEPGHVWAGNASGLGSFTTYGAAHVDGAFQAHVYSAPRASAGEVVLTVETQISPENCGRPVSAETLQLEPNGTVTTQAVELVVPGCAAEGDYLVLHNMLEDLTLPIQ